MQHWDNIREGSSMNFLVEPMRELTPNSVMDEEQIVIAQEFLDELASLGVLIEVAPGEMVANGPLFCLSKPGQLGQWRILSNMQRGRQNEAIGPDPTVFPKPGIIMEQMYTGGWPAVVDANKLFYQFCTWPEERKYLGCIHPRDPTRHFTYASLPMGAAQSPSLAGRYGAAFLRLLRSTSTLTVGGISRPAPLQSFAWTRTSSVRGLQLPCGTIIGVSLVWPWQSSWASWRAWWRPLLLGLAIPTYGISRGRSILKVGRATTCPILLCLSE
jgi:hypothetical protein